MMSSGKRAVKLSLYLLQTIYSYFNSFVVSANGLTK